MNNPRHTQLLNDRITELTAKINELEANKIDQDDTHWSKVLFCGALIIALTVLAVKYF